MVNVWGVECLGGERLTITKRGYRGEGGDDKSEFHDSDKMSKHVETVRT